MHSFSYLSIEWEIADQDGLEKLGCVPSIMLSPRTLFLGLRSDISFDSFSSDFRGLSR